MGVYLSAPATEKESEDKKCEAFTYGASSMQGWRMSQEDAHNCLPEFDPETNTSLFAVYDGHGGTEVAKYSSANLPNFIKSVEKYKNKQLVECLKEAFIDFDEKLTQEDVIKELKVIAGDDDGDEDEEDDDIAVRKEADTLHEEASMPIEELRAKYSGNPLLQQNAHLKAGKQPSPMIKAKRSKQMTGNGSTDDSVKEQLDLKVESEEHPDNDNNLNTEKELKDSSVNNNSESDSNEKSDAAVSSTSECKVDVKNLEVSNESVSSSSKDNGTQPGNSVKEAASGSSSVSSSSGSSGMSSEAASSTSSGSGDGASSSGSSSVGSSKAGGSSSGVESGPSGSGEPGSSGDSGKVKRSGTTLADLYDDDDDDDEDTSEDDDEYNSDDDEEEDDEDDDEENGPGLINYVKDSMDQPDEEPGSDSGCTAVVALLRDNELVVANAGDSRCVLCRDGKAVDLSIDHKPEDKLERDRIEAAGGQVTEDGRVNGGLNLSRALGDHYYKRNETKEAKDQMISAYPDVECATIGDKDEFFVLACDGIWNYMTSQEVVDFVSEQLKDTEKLNKPSLICEELFDHCLAPDTSGDGTGCDNMTCIIVVFNQRDRNNKKHVLDTSGSSEPPGKRQKTDGEDEGS